MAAATTDAAAEATAGAAATDKAHDAGAVLTMDALWGACALPLLARPDSYSPATFDWLDPTSPVSFQRWMGVFRKSTPGFRAAIAGHPSLAGAEQQAARFEKRFNEVCDAVEADPRGYPLPGCKQPPQEPIRLCALREMVLAECGIVDAFSTTKSKENATALELLPSVLEEVDAAPAGAERFALLLRGVFAGNVFDLGSASSAELFESGQASFHATQKQLLPRPWAVDDVNAAAEALSGGGRRGAPYDGVVVMFVDNAGSDVVLGMLPLAREVLRSHPACTLVLAANERPSINDVTAAELRGVLDAAADALGAGDPLSQAWAGGRLRVQSSGSGLPVIDLRHVGPGLAAAAQDAQLVVLEGMGRAVETNLKAATEGAFACDALLLGMVKHPEVAECMRARLYDCVCRFVPAKARGGLGTGS